jgi:hypothetical protein
VGDLVGFIDVGFIDGGLVGDLVGFIDVGFIDGDAVGDLVGFIDVGFIVVGFFVDFIDGGAIGFIDGGVVTFGRALGGDDRREEGGIVGDPFGCDDGLDEGEPVGNALGWKDGDGNERREQADAPYDDDVPGAQSRHVDAPTISEYDPGEQ